MEKQLGDSVWIRNWDSTRPLFNPSCCMDLRRGLWPTRPDCRLFTWRHNGASWTWHHSIDHIRLISVCHCICLVPFSSYWTLKYIVKSAGYPASLCTIAEIYRPATIILPLTECGSVFIRFYSELWKTIASDGAMRLFKIIQGHTNRKPVCNFLYDTIVCI